MRINGDKLRERVEASDQPIEALAGAVVRKGLPQRRAESAIRNWMTGRDHPRAKAEDIHNLAEALGCRPVDLARFVSVGRFQRSSPRKARLAAEMIKGRRVDDAVTALEFNHRRASDMLLKTLRAAIADAEQSDADVGRLFVAESRIDGGPIIKRFQPKDRGRAFPINKRTCHIVVGVEEAA